MGLTVLDAYDYTLLPGVVRVELEGFTDPAISDIMSELHSSDYKLFVEGKHYEYTGDYDLYYTGEGRQVYMDLKVVEIIKSL